MLVELISVPSGIGSLVLFAFVAAESGALVPPGETAYRRRPDTVALSGQQVHTNSGWL
jgi:hypothetical protein